MSSVDSLEVSSERKFSARRFLDSSAEFTRRLEPFAELEEGETCLLECCCKGFPVPAVTWYKDSQLIPDNHPYYRQSYENGTARLLIEEVLKVDEGAFKCRAENREGSASTTSYVTVIEDVKNKLLSQQQKDSPTEHAISSAPHLKTITEQKSLEEREAEVTLHQPPSPIQDYIDKLRRDKTWPLYPPLPRMQSDSIDSQASDVTDLSGDSDGIAEANSSGSDSGDSQILKLEPKRATELQSTVSSPELTAEAGAVKRDETVTEATARDQATVDLPETDTSLSDDDFTVAAILVFLQKRLGDLLDSDHVCGFSVLVILSCVGVFLQIHPLYFIFIISLVTLAYLLHW